MAEGLDSQEGKGTTTATTTTATTTMVTRLAFRTACVGGMGALFGSIYGTLRNRPASVIAVNLGLLWSVYGAAYFGTREAVVGMRGDVTSVPGRVVVSGTAGALAGGAMNTLTQGRAKLVPGFLAFGLLAAAGQVAVETAEAFVTWKSRPRTSTETVTAKASAWLQALALYRRLDDDEYRQTLKRRLQAVHVALRNVEREIAHEEEQLKMIQG